MVSLTWLGRELQTYTDDYYRTTYTYNADGIRTSKEVYELGIGISYLTEYMISGSCILGEKVYYSNGGDYEEQYTVIYLYDDFSTPIGMKYRTPSYVNDEFDFLFFEKNLQGDIVALYNGSGEKLCSYFYDAWGVTTVSYTSAATSSSMFSVIASNPFRYRGYYYDTETGYYYLQSRYYNPTWGRFLNADSYISTGQGIIGYNMFAYCNNNPINYIDSSGQFPWLLVAALLLFTPLGGTVLQISTSVLSYCGMAVASVFDEEVKEDMKRIGWNPFNSDESATINSSKVSFYKGVPVFRTDSSGTPGSFAAIFLPKGSSADLLRHERGHNWQLMMMGIANYGFMIGLPSWLEWSNRYYYDRPWEITADVLGDLTRPTHTQADINRGYWYLGVSSLFGPFGYFFLFGEY